MRAMRFAPAFVLADVLALALLSAAPGSAAPHSGTPRPRTAPELSDVALFVMAAAGVWLVRRGMRARLANRKPDAAD